MAVSDLLILLLLPLDLYKVHTKAHPFIHAHFGNAQPDSLCHEALSAQTLFHPAAGLKTPFCHSGAST